MNNNHNDGALSPHDSYPNKISYEVRKRTYSPYDYVKKLQNLMGNQWIITHENTLHDSYSILIQKENISYYEINLLIHHNCYVDIWGFIKNGHNIRKNFLYKSDIFCNQFLVIKKQIEKNYKKNTK